MGLKPYPEQLLAAKAAAKHSRGIISAVTGSGKSLIAALIINELQVRTLIVVPSIELKTQLSESMKRWFSPKQVGKGKDIYIENVQALDPKELQTGYDCVIIDEFHHSGAKTYQKLNKTAWKNIYYRFGLTSTPFRNNEDERLLLESVLSIVIYKLDYFTAAFKGYIVPAEAYYLEVPKQTTDAYTWAQVYSELVVNNDIRNNMIADLLLKLDALDIPTLCLVKEVAHGQILSDITGLHFTNGKDGNTRSYIEDFNSKRITTLIGTTGILGEGIDTKPAEYIVIAGLGKAKSAFMQQVGRGLRRYSGKDSCKIILIKDRSHKFCSRHFKAQCDILKEDYGVIATKLEF